MFLSEILKTIHLTVCFNLIQSVFLYNLQNLRNHQHNRFIEKCLFQSTCFTVYLTLKLHNSQYCKQFKLETTIPIESGNSNIFLHPRLINKFLPLNISILKGSEIIIKHQTRFCIVLFDREFL